MNQPAGSATFEKADRALRMFHARMALDRALAEVDDAAKAVGGLDASLAIEIITLGTEIRRVNERIGAFGKSG